MTKETIKYGNTDNRNNAVKIETAKTTKKFAQPNDMSENVFYWVKVNLRIFEENFPDITIFWGILGS